MNENTSITQLVAVTDTMRPWTAGSAHAKTYEGRIPESDARDFLTGFDVHGTPMMWLREPKVWDNPAMRVTIDGTDYTVVTTAERQVVYGSTSDRVHGVPTDGYTITQPSSLIDRGHNIIGAGSDLSILAVTVLDKEGAEHAITIGTREAVTVDGVGSFVPCVVLGTSANGTISNWFAGCSLQVVCYNTQAHALGEAAGNGTLRKVKHTKNAAALMDVAENEVREALGILEFQVENTQQVMTELSKIRVTAEKWSEYVQALTPVADDAKSNTLTRAEKSRAAWTELFNSGKLGEPDNAWTALQAVNTADVWAITRSTRGGTDAFARSQRELLTGKRDAIETDAYDTLRKVLATV